MNFADLTMAAPGSGERQAALMLHGMDAVDRQWLLDRLPTGQRARLHGLLEELAALGVAPDAGRLLPALSEGPGSYGRNGRAGPQGGASDALSQPSDRSVLMRLSEPNVTALAQALQREPAALVVQCLRVAAWPWAEALLRQLPASQRRQIESELSVEERAALSERHAAVLCKALRSRCKLEEPDPGRVTGSAPRGGLGKVRSTLGGSLARRLRRW